MKTMLRRKKTRIALIILFALSISLIINVKTSYSTSAFISAGESEYFKIWNLKADVEYIITVSSFSEYLDYDIGFTIHTNDDFDIDSKLITKDNPGLGTESALFEVDTAGDYYLEVWINGEDGGIVEIWVEENISGQDVMVVTYTAPYVGPNLLWLWIMLGVGGLFTILFIVIIVLVGAKAGKKMLEEAKKIDFSQVENPLTVIKKRGKRICPYCRIKIPEEANVTCPYCGAPITEEEY